MSTRQEDEAALVAEQAKKKPNSHFVKILQNRIDIHSLIDGDDKEPAFHWIVDVKINNESDQRITRYLHPIEGVGAHDLDLAKKKAQEIVRMYSGGERNAGRKCYIWLYSTSPVKQYQKEELHL